MIQTPKFSKLILNQNKSEKSFENSLKNSIKIENE